MLNVTQTPEFKAKMVALNAKLATLKIEMERIAADPITNWPEFKKVANAATLIAR